MLGANDGIISTASLIVGVAAAAAKQNTMDRALVLFALAVALGVAGNPQAEVRRRGPRFTTEPIEPFDRKTFAIKFQPQEAPAGLAR